MIPDYIQQLQDDVWAALSADSGFEFVPVYRSRTPLLKDENGEPIPGTATVIENQIEEALSGIAAKNGKCGVAVIVMLPDVAPLGTNSIGPSLEMILRVRIMEDRLFNEGAAGTGLSASRLALHTVQVLNRRAFRGMTVLSPDPKKMIDEVPLPDDRACHEVVMRCNQSVERAPKTTFPHAAVEDGQVTLTCTTAGAVIYYSTNREWPLPGEAWTTEYTAPFTLEPGTHALRVVAIAPDHQPSDDLWAAVTVSAP